MFLNTALKAMNDTWLSLGNEGEVDINNLAQETTAAFHLFPKWKHSMLIIL